MARKLLILALVFVAIVGLAAAAAPAPSTTKLPAAQAPAARAPSTTKSPAAPAPSTTKLPVAQAPMSNDFIGTVDEVAAGGPSEDGTTAVPGPMENTTSAEAPASQKDGAATLKFPAIAGGAAAVAGYFLF